ncbi:phosphatidate cytidylyltransferase [Actinomyces sp. B33]|uniref:phosphatidate cytidylyltransferase n=1 Tax=Actinomyces sp. B33 TaxID=2942131 RepID=UPI00233FE029|nr:phosphatidate cytidylyltransferase [Actinomyces sp. B33]MDC4232966.1 phosphatidate cytidylyltransferase [Actinomyces sp. B33]
MTTESPSSALDRILHPGPTREGAVLSSTGRAGRNLPAAITTGVLLASAVAIPLFLFRPLFVLVVVALAWAALWELGGAFARMGIELTMAPLYVGAVGMVTCAWTLGPEALLFALYLTVFAVIAWRLLSPGASTRIIDVVASIFAAVYIPFLASFVLLMLAKTGDARVLGVFILLIIGNDTGGWAAGVLFGKHPMAPRLSPKKSWEGFCGSVVATTAIGVVGMWWLGGRPAWGLLLGVCGAVVGTMGDLTESLIKREAGLKDMSGLLPGHGGVLDRIDAILMSAPVVYMIVAAAVGGGA